MGPEWDPGATPKKIEKRRQAVVVVIVVIVAAVECNCFLMTNVD
jgi:hypothetical protein